MKDGMFNNLLSAVGIKTQIDWIGDSRFALLTISLLSVWQFGSSMVIFWRGLSRFQEICMRRLLLMEHLKYASFL